MVYGEKEITKAPEDLLKEAGFSVSERCCSRQSCFDFAARKNDTRIFVKAQVDIDNFSPTDSADLKALSECMSGASLIIGERTREKPLEDDTVYSRYDVRVVTPKTFENIMLRKTFPLIHAGPGGYYVEIHGEAIRSRRQEMGLSVGEMALMIGISRRTLYGYERGMAKASVSAAYNTIYILGVPVAEPIDVFEASKSHRKCLFSTAKFAITKSKLLQKIFGKFKRCNITTFRKAPFDFVLSVPEEAIIIGGVAGRKESELNKRVDEILSISKVVEAHSILITEDHELSKKDILCMCKDELSKIKNPEELISNFK